MDYCDPLGFTRQTEILLRGLGATNLIKECKRKNVSTNVLHKLNKEDFITLGNVYFECIFFFLLEY